MACYSVDVKFGNFETERDLKNLVFLVLVAYYINGELSTFTQSNNFMEFIFMFSDITKNTPN